MRGAQEKAPAESGEVPRKYGFFGPHVGQLCPLNAATGLAASQAELADVAASDELLVTMQHNSTPTRRMRAAAGPRAGEDEGIVMSGSTSIAGVL